MNKPDTEYSTSYNVMKNTTTISIIYKGSRLLSLEYYGQLQPVAVKEYAIEAVQLLIDKGVIKREIN